VRDPQVNGPYLRARLALTQYNIGDDIKAYVWLLQKIVTKDIFGDGMTNIYVRYYYVKRVKEIIVDYYSNQISGNETQHTSRYLLKSLSADSGRYLFTKSTWEVKCP
jgi:hypothetical protein